MIGKIRGWIKDKAGVSPIIAIILMVAITVVLAATIYVWVSGMGKGGTSAPSISATVDNVNGRLIISQADKGLTWDKVKISWTGSPTSVTLKLINTTSEDITSNNGNYVTTHSYTISGGDYIEFSGSGTVTVTLTYGPTNTNWGTWTLYL